MPSGRDRGSCTLRITRGAEAAFMAIFPVQRRSIFRIKTDIFRSDCGWKRSVYPHSTGISGPRRTATLVFYKFLESLVFCQARRDKSGYRAWCN
jgi:hypothetical protein